MYDPALTAIAVAMNDALTDHLWRYDTSTANSGDPIAQLSISLCQAAQEFNTTATVLAQMLNLIPEECGRQLAAVTTLASTTPHTLDIGTLHVAHQFERFDAQRETLLSLYAVWRRHRLPYREPGRRHLLLHPYDPRGGMAALTAYPDETAWLVTPDQVAAAAFGLRTYGCAVGEIRLGEGTWQTAAFADPEHQNSGPNMVYPLPAVETEAVACRTLLRWCALRNSDRWQGRTPAQLSTDELSVLTA